MKNGDNITLDATFIPSTQELKLIIVGKITSINKFSLLSISLVKHETIETYEWVLQNLKLKRDSFLTSRISPDNVMADNVLL